MDWVTGLTEALKLVHESNQVMPYDGYTYFKNDGVYINCRQVNYIEDSIRDGKRRLTFYFDEGYVTVKDRQTIDGFRAIWKVKGENECLT